MTRPNDPSEYSSADPLAEMAAHGSQDGRQRVTREYAGNNNMNDAFGNSQGSFQSGYESGLARGRRQGGSNDDFGNSGSGGVFGSGNKSSDSYFSAPANNFQPKDMPTQRAGGYDEEFSPGDLSSNPTYTSGDGVTATRLYDHPTDPIDPDTGKASMNTAGTLALGTAGIAGGAALDRAMTKRAAANATPEQLRDAARYNAQRGHSEYNRYLNSRADRQLADEMAKGGSKSGRALREGASTVAREGAEKAEQQAGKQAGKQLGKQGAKQAAKQAGKQAAKQAGKVATKGATRAAVGVAGRLGARGALMAAGAAVPGPGWAIAAGVASTVAIEALFNPGFRSWCKGLMRSGGVAVDTPPEPPETHWLPNVEKDKREDVVKAVDSTLNDLNDTITGVDPDTYKMWDVTGGNEVPGLTRMLPVTDQLNLVADQLNTFGENVAGIVDGAGSSILGDYAESIKPSLQVLGTFNEDAGKPLSDAIVKAATTSNEAYQLLLDANQKSREALAQSSGDILHVIPHSSIEQKDLTTNQTPIKEKAQQLKDQQAEIEASINRWLDQMPKDDTMPTEDDYLANAPLPGTPGQGNLSGDEQDGTNKGDGGQSKNPVFGNATAPGGGGGVVGGGGITSPGPVGSRRVGGGGGVFGNSAGGGGTAGGTGSSPFGSGSTGDSSLPKSDGDGIFSDSDSDSDDTKPFDTDKDGKGLFDTEDSDSDDEKSLDDKDGDGLFDTDGDDDGLFDTDGDDSGSELGVDDGNGLFDTGDSTAGDDAAGLPGADGSSPFGSSDGGGLFGDGGESGSDLGVNDGGGLFGDGGDSGSGLFGDSGADPLSTSGGGLFGDEGGSSLPGYGEDSGSGLGIDDGSGLFDSGDSSSSFDPGSEDSRGLGAFGSNGVDEDGNPLPHTGETTTTSGTDSAFKPDDELDGLFDSDSDGESTDGSAFDPEADTLDDGSTESTDPFGSDEDYDPFGGEGDSDAGTDSLDSADAPAGGGGSAFDGGEPGAGDAAGGSDAPEGTDGGGIFGDDSTGDTGTAGEPTDAPGEGGDNPAGGESGDPAAGDGQLPGGDVPGEGEGLFDDMYDENGELKDPEQRAADMGMSPEEAKEAMTVDINGEPTQFLNPETADLARSILDPSVDTSNVPFADLAESAGLTPGDGESIGVAISPAEVQPGDVMTVDGKDWLYVGGEQVMDPATGDMGQVSDLASNGFAGEGEGFFRLDNEGGEMLDESIGGAVDGEEPTESTSASAPSESESASESTTTSATDSASATASESESSAPSATDSASATASESSAPSATDSASATTGSSPVDTPAATPSESATDAAAAPSESDASDYRRSEEAPIGMGNGQNVPMDTDDNPVDGGGASAGGVEAGEGGSYADGQAAETDTTADSGIAETEFEGEALGGARPETHTSGADSIPAPGKMDPDSII